MAKIDKTPILKANDKTQMETVKTTQFDIKNLIYIIRNQQVMIDSNLAVLYQVETGHLNEAVKRNISRFPERFRFQLTKEEFEKLLFRQAYALWTIS